jgi:hypothetical protein
VSALADDPRARKLFGANGHGFALHEPLSPAELEEAEEQFGVRLPDDYRGFLAEVGAGGAGPFYGVFPLVRVDGVWGWTGDGGDLTNVRRLAEPFAGTPIDPAELAALLAEEPNEEGDEDPDADYDALYEAWTEKVVDVLWRPDRTVGAICLCHEGCAYRDWLVVSGPDRGDIWADPRTDYKDLSPTGISFGTLYLDWLAAQEAAL